MIQENVQDRQRTIVQYIRKVQSRKEKSPRILLRSSHQFQ